MQGLAAQSRGRLVLRSRPGEGTAAEVWFPVAEASAARRVATDAPAEPRGPVRPMTVLVVDDDQLVLENATAMLEDLRHRVIQAGSGSEALDVFRRTRGVDLVVTDHAMPGMTGTELAEQIVAERPGMPIILASGYTEVPADPRLNLIRLGKPFAQDTLAQAVADALRQAEDAGKVVAFRARVGDA